MLENIQYCAVTQTIWIITPWLESNNHIQALGLWSDMEYIASKIGNFFSVKQDTGHFMWGAYSVWVLIIAMWLL